MKSTLTNDHVEAWQVIHPARIRTIIDHVRGTLASGITDPALVRCSEVIAFLEQLHRNATVLGRALARFERDSTVFPEKERAHYNCAGMGNAWEFSPEVSTGNKPAEYSREVTLESDPIFNPRFPHQYIPIKLTFEAVPDGPEAIVPTYRTYIRNRLYEETTELVAVYDLYHVKTKAAAHALCPEAPAVIDPTPGMTM